MASCRSCRTAFAQPPLARIIASNRDEQVGRVTLPLHSFRIQPASPEILAGRDGLHHGTWLGVNDLGYIAAVTNSRELPRDPTGGGESRGTLVLDALAAADQYSNILQYIQRRVGPRANAHQPFNLLLIDSVLDEICCFGTHDAAHKAGERINESLLALSNGTVHSDWFKMHRGLRLLTASLGADRCDESQLVERILGVLLDRTPASGPQELPRNTCLTAELEERLSPIFIVPFSTGPHGWDGAEATSPNDVANRQFGTVSSTIVLIDRDATLATVYEFDWRRAGTCPTIPSSVHPIIRQVHIRRGLAVSRGGINHGDDIL